GDLTVDAQRKIGIGVADDAVVGLIGSAASRRHSIDAPRSPRRAGELLFAGRAHAEEDRSVERPDGLTWDEAFRDLIGLPLTAHESRRDEARATQVHHLGPL